MNVVFLIFNRPMITARVFARIRVAQPSRLLIVSDGARLGRGDEAEIVKETRRIAEQVDWPCHVLTNYATHNMGCRRRVASGLTWAFQQVEDAIVLEDDCLPTASFFQFCQDMLCYHRSNKKVMHIGGDNFIRSKHRRGPSYYFSKYAHVWGWATWRRAWEKYDVNMSMWRTRGEEIVCRACSDADERRYWCGMFEMMTSGAIDTWDYPWLFTCWASCGLSIVPQVNLVTNLGIGGGTHTNDPGAGGLCMPTEDIRFPLIHPERLEADQRADRSVFQKVFMRPESFKEKVCRRLGL